MAFQLRFTTEARDQLEALQSDQRKLKRVHKCLGLIQTDPRYPGLHTHKYSQMKTSDHRDVWQSYVENRTPAAWRVFWCYGPDTNDITIVAITEHP